MKTKRVVISALAMMIASAATGFADYTVPYVDDVNTFLLYHMDTETIPDDDSANPGRDRDAYSGVVLPTLTNSSYSVAHSNAAVFNGVDSRIHVKNSKDMPLDNLRYEFWAKQDMAKNGDNSNHFVFLQGWNAGIVMRDRADDWRIDFQVWDSNNTLTSFITTDGGLEINLNDWNHFAMEIENGTLKTYVNGILKNETGSTIVGGLQVPGRFMDIGMNYNGGQQWAGLVDEFRIYSLAGAITTPYTLWINQYAAGAGAETNQTDNPDGDALNNLYEWGLGGDPTNSADIGHVPTFGTVEDGGANWFEYVHAKRNNAGNLGLDYYLDLKTDLVSGSWASNDYVVGTGTLDGEFDAVTNRVPTDVEDAQFIQLMIESN